MSTRDGWPPPFGCCTGASRRSFGGAPAVASGLFVAADAVDTVALARLWVVAWRPPRHCLWRQLAVAVARGIRCSTASGATLLAVSPTVALLAAGGRWVSSPRSPRDAVAVSHEFDVDGQAANRSIGRSLGEPVGGDALGLTGYSSCAGAGNGRFVAGDSPWGLWCGEAGRCLEDGWVAGGERGGSAVATLWQPVGRRWLVGRVATVAVGASGRWGVGEARPLEARGTGCCVGDSPAGWSVLLWCAVPWLLAAGGGAVPAVGAASRRFSRGDGPGMSWSRRWAHCRNPRWRDA